MSPSAFSLYFDLIPALEDDRFDEANALAATLIKELQRPAYDSPELLMMTRENLGVVRHDLVAKHFSDPYFGEAYLLSPDATAASIRMQQVSKALLRMERHVPELHGEITQTIREIIFAGSKPVTSPEDYSFDGASSLEYWGAIALNTSIRKSDLQVFEMLAHESGHNTLFALSPYDFFVFNPDDERHPSPLRDDPRPLDGIYHATFVLARMHYAIRRLLQSEDISIEERGEGESLLRLYQRHFESGHSVLDQHADYTASGARIMAEAKSYMDRNRLAD